MKYYVVVIDKNRVAEWQALAYGKANCIGQCDFSLEEAEVDRILGERAFSGGDIGEDLIDEVIISQANSKTKLFFETLEDARFFTQQCLTEGLEIIEEQEEDWNESWRKHYKRIEIEGLVSIVPSWEQESGGETEVLIYPGQGFGTGEHETTRLCLEELAKMDLEYKHCLDFGCGSGILGIVVIKLCGAQVDFCDIDSSALDNCLQNLTLNFKGRDLSGTELILRERFSPKKYDLIFANILQPVILEESDLILSALDVGGKLIISGILKGQEKAIIDKIKGDAELESQSQRGDWVSLAFKRL